MLGGVINMQEILNKLAESKRYGIILVEGEEVLVNFYEKEGELVGAFHMVEEKFKDGFKFSAEIYRSVGKVSEKDKVIADLISHILSLFKEH